ncbi:acyltransferase [Ideonella sp. YS5]|uniref:acyltransferase n=1 Tax=Ideonella sp. YS5 TaxID=3453714 RepID=UPI003EE8FC38
MSTFVEKPHLEPLMRIMGLPPSLVRYLPVTAQKPLRTMLLRESSLARSLAMDWADDCYLTLFEGEDERLTHVSLAVTGARRTLSGVHLALLGHKGQLNLVLGGDHLKVVVGAETTVRGALHLAAKATAFIGDRTTIGQARMNASNADLVIGDDCQLSEDVVVQCSDQHAIVEQEGGAPVFGYRRHVRIGRHVWLGRRAMVLPDVTIGQGSVIESGAVVRSDVPANTLAGGSPAQVLREKIDWRR